MATVFIPSLLRPLADGATTLQVPGRTLREVIDNLGLTHGGLRDRIVDGDGVRPEIMIAIDSDEAFDLNAPVAADAEVHILPAIAGGGSAEPRPIAV
jgi:molybdopterin converting factor small subunit